VPSQAFDERLDGSLSRRSSGAVGGGWCDVAFSQASESRPVVGLAIGPAATAVCVSGALAQQKVERCVVEGLGVLVQPGV